MMLLGEYCWVFETLMPWFYSGREKGQFSCDWEIDPEELGFSSINGNTEHQKHANKSCNGTASSSNYQTFLPSSDTPELHICIVEMKSFHLKMNKILLQLRFHNLKIVAQVPMKMNCMAMSTILMLQFYVKDILILVIHSLNVSFVEHVCGMLQSQEFKANKASRY